MAAAKYILGIDTSNYKTSVAIVCEDKIVCDLRKFLIVKKGERGLRQSEAFFQHIQNLPEMFEAISREKLNISGISYSYAPRPIEGSYMPCFTAGASFAKSIGALLNVPVYKFSHQEGHIEAVKYFSQLKDTDEFIGCHFSGGTCEVLKIRTSKSGERVYDIEQIGGSKDISFGQVLDRAGVYMDMNFPAGEEMDNLALSSDIKTSLLTKIKVKDGELNLSGIDTQIKNILADIDKYKDQDMTLEAFKAAFTKEIFTKLSDAIYNLLLQCVKKADMRDILMSGGVSSSLFIRQEIIKKFEQSDINIHFDDMNLSSDNAVGTAILGGRFIWE